MGTDARRLSLKKAENDSSSGKSASEANKGVRVMTETNMLSVNSWVDNTQDLEQQQREISEKLHFSRMMEQRQRLADLENQVAEDYKRVKSLRSLAYDTAIRNKAEIEKLKLETARLINESVSIDNESVMLELSLRPKQQQLTELRREIEADKIAG
jgi:uncharacterized protein YpiB (UPF0302 family)